MTMILTNPRERSRFFRFATVGITGAMVDFGTMNLLTRLVGLPLVVAGTLSFGAAILNNFTWNRHWTYPDSRSKPLVQQLVQFALVSVMGLGIRLPILAFVKPLWLSVLTHLPFEIPFFSLEFLSNNLTLVIAVVIVMFWNFFVNRYWTYNDVE
ncbi:MAG TPA: GtrA family protein [Chloroflexi bacterium]|nr:GtrA family protein [Chloroflexota bacterium]